MTPLAIGIYNYFKAAPANTFYTAMGGRMYFGEAPQGATFPYCVMSIISSEHDWTFDDEMESVLVQFSIFTNESSAVNIGLHWSKLKSLYDDASLTVSGYTQVSLLRGQSILLRETENNIWQYAVEYECLLEVS